MTIPTAWHEQTEREIGAAHRDGYLQALHDIATRAIDISRNNANLWRAARGSAEQRHARRLAEMEAAAVRLADQMGRPPGWRYRGGPVDYDTGLPVGSACAWLRRRRTPPPRIQLEQAA